MDWARVTGLVITKSKDEMKLPIPSKLCSRKSVLFLLITLMPVPQALAENDYVAARKAMVSEIEADVELLQHQSQSRLTSRL